MSNKKKYILTSSSCELKKVRSIICEMGQELSIDHKTVHDIMLAVNEAFSNIIEHSYHNKSDGKIILEVTYDDSLVVICLTDYGRPVKKEKIKHRDLDDIRPGGLGVFFMNKCMDRVDYLWDAEEKANHLVMEKKIEKKELIMENDIAIVNLIGDIDLYRSPDIRKQLSVFIDKKVPVLIIDLKEVSFIDSSGLATLIEVLQKSRKYGGKLFLTGINEKIHNVFEISRLEDVFTICADIEEARRKSE